MWSSQLWLRLKQSQSKPGASTGIEPMASALALQCSTNWAMKTHTLASWPIYWIHRTRERNETYQWIQQSLGRPLDLEVNKLKSWPLNLKVPAAFLSRWHMGCFCLCKLALPFTELSLGFEYSSRCRHAMQHFRIPYPVLGYRTL